MNILITGGNGFVAREIIIALELQGHKITACIRNFSTRVLENESVKFIQIDFKNNTDKSFWISHLKNIDVVINCVGVFQTATEKEMWAIHYDAPTALFEACVDAGVKKIIHISALGVDKSDVTYAKSKLAAEKYLQNLNIDSVIIRPSFVYGHGSYGGSSLFRGLCGLPFFIFLPGGGKKLLQPLHVHDLVKIIQHSLNLSGKHLLSAGGSEKLSLKDILIKLRAWLGFKKAINFSVPLIFIKITAKFGDFFRNAPLSSTGVKLMAMDNVLTNQEFENLTKTVSFTPRSFTQGLNNMVSAVQDRWHARLFFLRPLLRLSIAYLWIFSGIISLVAANIFSYPMLERMNINSPLKIILLFGASGLDILLGFAVLFNYRLKIIGSIQVALMIIFTIITSFYLQIYWLFPFAPIAKNIPLIFATLVMMALESDR
ncbi:MAG TPA: SDR family oxidoreductase [Coxiellaceae bacterium]|nr:MAG: hypothetical protein A3E81_03070 [Gammaproteobacteria bacterium RIFCSPHIGHO2_12_FULL_36_30]HLB56296.1 SDR family oxidoreductase [Coxiellaceae bacterium]